ncbi:MAG: hypothetical protein OXN86_05005 [Chloroflexota bacterium]|nr:hypothetical protein [Chloroflexota bacterium]
MTPTRTKEEVGRLGREIYDRDIRALVEADHYGEYIVIDVDHSCWAMADSLFAARDLLDQQRPDPESRNVYGRAPAWDACSSRRSPGRKPPADRPPRADAEFVLERSEETWRVRAF